MIAKKILPSQFKQWNAKMGAPFGKPYFCFEPNNSTREYEYPWAAFATPIKPGQRILEIGGSLSGFQFILSLLGCQVENVDPGRTAKGNVLACDKPTIEMLNRRFNTSVEFNCTTMENAALASNSYDRVFSISVIEHIPEKDIEAVMRSVYQCLKPGGYFIITIDLFLNVFPFTSRMDNAHGTNINVRQLVEKMPFELAFGRTSELYGYPEFSADNILSNLDKYYYGTLYPTLIQCVVLKKPE